MQESYYDIFVRQIENLGENNHILLHSCCAPCSSHCLKVLREYAKVTVFYYNPNITERDEYNKRKDEEIRLIGVLNEEGRGFSIDYVEADYDPEVFLEMAKGHEMDKERGERCTLCYGLRLERTAMKAVEVGADLFATTLTLSPLKDTKRLNEIGLSLEEKYGVKYLVSDFKKKDGYKHSIELSAEYGLYRQDYCGCVFSKRDREIEKKLKEVKA